ncbi:MAG: GntR family transcriptional regulator [Treponema sp.]|jgi:DNA-binding transcriptional regulator YhcF (GntR family)|nr:GntR family transcriptional regulator [Treponema sp.]
MDEIKGQIASGRLVAGARIGSIRDLAAFYAVNPNTIQRALLELEREGLLSTQRASGKFVTEDENMIRELRSRLAEEQINKLLTTMKTLGFSVEETRDLLAHALAQSALPTKPAKGDDL